MTNDELARLKRVIADKPRDAVEAQFFIYRLESLIYQQGNYASVPFYTTLYAWPPIQGLTFNPPTFDATRFRHHQETGTSVAIGIVDDGIAFAHKRFRAPDGSSRVHAIWLQETEQGEQNGGVSFGKILDVEAIDKLLANVKNEDDIYRQVNATNFGTRLYNPLAARATHGTHVLDLAAGYDPPREKFERPIFAVQLPSVATIDTSGMTMGSYVIQAVRMIMDWTDMFAAARSAHLPLVINFSYGVLAGPKDGTQYLEHALAALIDHRNCTGRPTRLVVPAGNSYRERAAAIMQLVDDTAHNIDWVVLPDDGAPNYVEIWLDEKVDASVPAPIAVALTPPGEPACPPVVLKQGTMRVLRDSHGRAIAGIYYDVSTLTTRPRVLFAIAPTVRNDQHWALAPSGRWNVTIAKVSQPSVTAHLYVQRDDTPFGYPRKGRQSHFDDPRAYCRDRKTGDYRVQASDCPIIYQDTLSAIATSPSFVVVGGAEATDGHPPTDYASSGPTRRRPAPDHSAFADDGDAHWGMLASGTLSSSYVRINGTSVTAPQVARQLVEELSGAGSPPTIPVSSTTDQLQLGPDIIPITEIPANIKRRYRAT